MLGIDSRALCMLHKHSTGKLCSQLSHTTFVFFTVYFEPESKLPRLALDSLCGPAGLDLVILLPKSAD